MKRLCLLAALCLTLTACAPAGESAAQSSSALPQAITQWPDNAYTALLPQPEAGTPDYVIDSGASYAVFYKNITRSQGEAYVAALQQAGFICVAEEIGAASAGYLLEKEGAAVSVSLSEGVLGLNITRSEP